MSIHWIRDAEGVCALVDSAAMRDFWTKVNGWTEIDRPEATDQVHVVNEHPEIGPGRLPWGAVELWAGLGWSASPPPGAEPIADVKPVKAPAVAGEPKEK